MTKEQIYTKIKQLATSQGCWGRLLNEREEYGIRDEALQELEDMNFQNSLQLILFLEGN